MIALNEVGRTFPGPPEVAALRDATFTVDAGEMVAIIGPSGSGKSTLLNVLGLLDEPTSGTYLLNGVDTGKLKERSRTALRATTLGFVFQSAYVVAHLDCMANVALPLTHLGVPRKERPVLAEAALRSVGLGHRLHARPNTLSGGERQRVAIARAIVHEPRVLLCDEPTGNLDSENTQAVLDLLENLVTGDRAVVVVTHENEVADRAGRTVKVVDGHAAPLAA
ncbi:ABC transporter ATP-binding protein [Phytomonospora endophytica]|uniref:Putative ABC transport system ATP-binding protein n=1 Tax=Phytomonospora endophytica TaxID=714109 RepID=A0A841FSX6_9ACTN|nr:ABC transporter ATP-binding protein [Phytomonospora endophytica]MBB6036642.1 putative ABC transport system ATP-binding protein [Phytomonospora endophytica]GIG65963.1 peptide ABC transporter ATP-binding protein [Phytomonospora endophytica]